MHVLLCCDGLRVDRPVEGSIRVLGESEQASLHGANTERKILRRFQHTEEANGLAF